MKVRDLLAQVIEQESQPYTYKAVVTFQGITEEFEVHSPVPYDARIEGARLFLSKHPGLRRRYEDTRRHTSGVIRPYWLATNGHVHLVSRVDRRYR